MSDEVKPNIGDEPSNTASVSASPAAYGRATAKRLDTLRHNLDRITRDAIADSLAEIATEMERRYGPISEGDLREALARPDELAQIPALIMANIEAVPGWEDSTALITARCHAYVLHHDPPDAFRSAAGQSITGLAQDGSSHKNTPLQPSETGQPGICGETGRPCGGQSPWDDEVSCAGDCLGKPKSPPKATGLQPSEARERLKRWRSGEDVYIGGGLYADFDALLAEMDKLAAENAQRGGAGWTSAAMDEALSRAEAAEAERDKLAGENERLHRELMRANQFHENASARACAAEEQSAARWRVQDDLFAQLQTAESNLSSEAKAHEVTKGKLAGLVEGAFDALAAAYEQGCVDTHKAIQEEPDLALMAIEHAEFGEAARDYAHAALAALDQPTPSETAHDQ